MALSPAPAVAAGDLARALGLVSDLDGVLALGPLRVRPLALGWATVDLDRAVEEAYGRGPYAPARPESLVGATARLGQDGPRSDPARQGAGPGRDLRIVLLEPSTEGRLAAFLARRGEGWAVLYVALVARGSSPPGGEAADDGAQGGNADLAALSRAGYRFRQGTGPLGDEALVLRPGAAPGGRDRGAGPVLILVVAGDGPDPAPDGRGSAGEGVPSRP